MYTPSINDLSLAGELIDVGARLAEGITLADIPDLAISLVHGEGAEQLLAETTATAIFMKMLEEGDAQMAYEALAEALEAAIEREEYRDVPDVDPVDVTPLVEAIKSPGPACGEE